ncbi:Lrp/AsnC family transcriptional regulator [Aeromicrobium fastidiosum]|uniref:Lrp/AsnC family transcriptional regulator n=1 Tax=Aeromicrobium fastidiosum TaxID=52699 RepID=UPI0020237805|nr:Lrp/AsnC family transcriptional regulator [Aeromicrobium fastidiosum]MCL8251933.1 Lrp/AsnC family transcriptional regulator [Aeromicrobium fastidiosum]
MDDLDRQLIGCLLEDGRATYAAIGERIGLSSPAVKRRMDRLVADGVIAGFTAILDPHLVGWTTEAYVEVHCKGTISPDELRAAFGRVPEVHAAATVSGAADAILHIVAKDVRDLERALERVRVETDNVDRTETAIVLSRLIDRHGPGQAGFSPPDEVPAG